MYPEESKKITQSEILKVRRYGRKLGYWADEII